jgi:formylglycine-generating enzyme required for sulfatase activity
VIAQQNGEAMFRPSLVLVVLLFGGIVHSADQETKEVINSLGIKLVLIPSGTFTMGSTGNDAAVSIEAPFEATISKPFYLGAYEVTYGQYQRLMGEQIRAFFDEYELSRDRSMYPVQNVTWRDANTFCRLLSELPEEQAAGRSYRLPTEAEWEYACRAGSPARYCFGEDPLKLAEYAWFSENSCDPTDHLKVNKAMIASFLNDPNQLLAFGASFLTANEHPHPVGQKKQNAWGLYDMHGNVSEWCQDRAGRYPLNAATDPQGAPENHARPEDQSRMIRGGSYDRGADFCRSASRNCERVTFGSSDFGFRIVMITTSK